MTTTTSFMKTAVKTQPAAKTLSTPAGAGAGSLAFMRFPPHAFETLDIFTLIGQARAGLPVAEAGDLRRQLALTMPEVAAILNASARTLARRLKKAAKLGKSESERLLLLRQLTAHGVAVFEDQGKFNRWLRRPLPLLANQSPLDLLDTASGFQVVDELLGRIEYGVYS